jgi:hypothetical protein
VGERQCSERWKVRRYGRATVGFSEDSGLVQGRAGCLMWAIRPTRNAEFRASFAEKSQPAARWGRWYARGVPPVRAP